MLLARKLSTGINFMEINLKVLSFFMNLTLDKTGSPSSFSFLVNSSDASSMVHNSFPFM